MTQKPFPESYWVVPDKFLAGEYPLLRFDDSATSLRLVALLDAGFDTFIDLTSEGERPEYETQLKEEAEAYARRVKHLRFPFADFSIPSREGMRSVLDALDAALAQGSRVYLHCVGGVGRTGTVVGCWLIRHGMQPKDALKKLGELYSKSAQSRRYTRSPETDKQINFILNWKEDGLA
jgi:hypothetical protein